MGKPASKTLIGAFVVGAVALLSVAVIVFGGGKFFRPTQKAVTFFEGSVKGLNVGSPVMFRGVKIGSVVNIQLILSTKDLTVTTPVVFEVEPDRWTLYGEWTRGPEATKKLVNAGLKAQLQSLSVVTGQLMVGLDFFPDKPARYMGLMPQYAEIPSVPTRTEEIAKTLQDLPIKEMADNLEKTLGGIQRLVNSRETKEGVEAVQQAAVEVRGLVRTLNEKIVPLMERVGRFTDSADASLVQARTTMSAFQGAAAEISAASKKTLEAATAALERTNKTMTAVSDDSGLFQEVNRSLREISAAARSIRDLSEYLERHPEAIVRGKAGP